MNTLIRISILVVFVFAESSASANSIQDIAGRVQAEGWFGSCSKELPRLAKIKEPKGHSADWKVYVKIMAGCLSELRRDYEAIAYINRKFAGKKFDSDILEYLATSHIRIGNYDDSARLLESALELGVDERRVPEIHSKLALSYIQQAARLSPIVSDRNNLIASAERSIRRAIELSSTPSPILYTQLAQVQTFSGDLASAENSLNLALDLNSNYEWEKQAFRRVIEAEILMSKSQVRRLAGDENGAVILSAEAIKIAPTESLKIVLEEMDSVSAGRVKVPVTEMSGRSVRGSVLSQPYIPLDEEM
nr:hypothetical protein [Pseudomonas sp. A46]